MKVKFELNGGQNPILVLEAETDAERLALAVFSKEATQVKIERRVIYPRGCVGENAIAIVPITPLSMTENVRCGAAYEYLISSGMSPDNAERVIRGWK